MESDILKEVDDKFNQIIDYLKRNQFILFIFNYVVQNLYIALCKLHGYFDSGRFLG